MNLIHRTRPGRLFYADNINMNWSFDSLAALGKKLLGAEFEVGDILICDNTTKDKRKMLQMTADGFMIYYGRIKGAEFVPLAKSNGMLKHVNKGIL